MLQTDYQNGTCVNPQLGANERIAIITLSLGSKITIDSIVDLAGSLENPSPFAREILPRLHGMYMFANQLPLLELGREATALTKGKGAGAAGSLAALLQMRAQLAPSVQAKIGDKGAVPTLPIVAINDPNDLLSYSLTKKFVADMPQGCDFYDVTTPIGQRYLLGTVAHPMNAHTGHSKNRKVFRIVIDGAKVT